MKVILRGALVFDIGSIVIQRQLGQLLNWSRNWGLRDKAYRNRLIRESFRARREESDHANARRNGNCGFRTRG